MSDRHSLARPASRLPRPRGLSLGLLLTLLLVAPVATGLGGAPRVVRAVADRAPLLGRQCPDDRLDTTTVAVTVAPELDEVVRQVLAPLRTRRLPGRQCV